MPQNLFLDSKLKPKGEKLTLKGFGHPKFNVNASKLVSGFKTKT
jgi:hypothetical protein